MDNNIKANTVVGTVVSDKMNKTVVLVCERTFTHPKYQKIVRKRTKLYAHDEENAYKVGDVVRVAQSRPISKQKSWVVVEKVA